MTAHTPGPWEMDCVRSDGSFEIWSRRMEPRNSWCLCARSPIEHRAAESIANARLIAAAPRLLAAAKPMLEMATRNAAVSDEEWNDAIDSLSDAVAKAEGVPAATPSLTPNRREDTVSKESE